MMRVGGFINDFFNFLIFFLLDCWNLQEVEEE